MSGHRQHKGIGIQHGDIDYAMTGESADSGCAGRADLQVTVATENTGSKEAFSEGDLSNGLRASIF